MKEQLEIYVGDSAPLVVSWFIPSTENPFVSDDAVISNATVRVIRNRDRRVIVDDAVAEVSGNETIYTVDSELTSATGSFTAFMTAEFNDGIKATQSISYLVKPKT